MSTNINGKPTQFLVSTILSGTTSPLQLISDPSTIYDGYPITFSVDLTVDTQYHSDDTTPNPFVFDASDIEPNDWFALPSGKLYKVISIINLVNSNTVTVEIEDVDLFILKSDTSGSGNNYPDEGQAGIIFEVDSDGMPILSGITQLSSQFPNLTYWLQDIQSRFDLLVSFEAEVGIETESDLNQTPNVTAVDGDATGAFITFTPFRDSNVQILVNGINVNLGDGAKNMACYFSGDAGLNAREIKNIAAGDQLYWNGSIAGYELDGTDEIDVIYDASSDDL